MLDIEWLEPTSISETTQMLSHYQDEGKLVAGGTWVTLVLKQKLLMPSALISLRHIPVLREIEYLPGKGLKKDTKLHPIQEAFIENNAFQCSYCTPGMILATKSLLEEIPSPNEMQIKEYLSGNLCRCGSYVKIIAAVQDAANRLASNPEGK